MRSIVIGAGYFGVNYVRELAGNLVAVIEPNADRAKFVRERYNVPVFPDVPDDLVYDAAVIATPPHNHVQLALSEVKKHKMVLIEKPMATSVEEMLLLRNYKNQVMCGMIYLYNPAFLEFEAKLHTFNDVNHMYARRTNDGPVRSWQDAMWDLAAHDISMLNYLFGTPDRVSRMGMTDYSILNLGYAYIDALIYVSWRGGGKVRKFEAVPFVGERLVFDDMATTLSPSPLRFMLDDFMTGTWSLKAGFDAGLDVINVLEQASKM